MTKHKGELYWGYLDDEGQVFVKKYVSDRVIRNYESMPFVKGIFGPFRAANIKHASQLVANTYYKGLH